MTDIKRVGVLGSGLMGSGIAQVAAAAGYDTTVRDVSQQVWDKARSGIEKSLAKFVEKGKLAAADRDATLKRLRFTTTTADLKTCDIVVVRTVTTSAETCQRAFAFAKSLGKEPVAAKDNAGFIVNLLLVPYLLDAIRAVERGVGSVPDIDKAMQLGCGYPMGPLTLLDFVGLDTTHHIAEIMFKEYREGRYAPPPLLKRMVLAGMHGRKSGKGFYDYSSNPPTVSNLGL